MGRGARRAISPCARVLTQLPNTRAATKIAESEYLMRFMQSSSPFLVVRYTVSLCSVNVLSEVEARVLGSLIEKELTTPEYYPLSLNALVNACNQKSNRDPVMSLNEHAV